jgi:hypothetical protein
VAVAHFFLVRSMPAFVVGIAAAGFAGAIILFRYTAPSGTEFWYMHPWWPLLSFRTTPMLLISLVLFVVYSTFVFRRASKTFWFVALAVSCLPAIAALWPAVDELRSNLYLGLDAANDFPYLFSTAIRIYTVSLLLSLMLAFLTAYGYFARTRPNQAMQLTAGRPDA